MDRHNVQIGIVKIQKFKYKLSIYLYEKAVMKKNKTNLHDC